MLKCLLKLILLILFIISPFFAPPASAMEHAGFRSKNNLTHVDITHFYNNWKGVRYKLGGSSKRGIDCSALTQRVFKKKNIHLPRTTSAQIVLGKSIAKHQLRPGDLVFFRINKNQRHVGIYMGNGKFMHASTRKGVTLSHLASRYWEKRYETSRRITS
ncbi:NlpC/P60 family protein [Enterobacteriaceae bacterium H20N1]|uniref:NlpC/P60 family protein n=1 Tax=Dryocola boscaweniae TaxID=2925397 RepID=A0A9X2WAE1_9ENTR|nr:NlpC/P60 family protein [Dryocola boscaweniae]MCT4703854.1 NlpC/P60 family protein [Dryocola boscaweniae]MCT4721022.1 NlpC/P60 family protein [Dryocola boscaweniae]